VLCTACELHSDKEATWRQEFAKWCAAFYAFKREYNHWLCLKVTIALVEIAIMHVYLRVKAVQCQKIIVSCKHVLWRKVNILNSKCGDVNKC